MLKLMSLVFVVLFSGCLIRTYTIQKPRADLDIQGNRGFIFGEPKPEQKESKLGKTRTISVVEIELGSHQPREYTRRQPQQPQTFRREPIVEIEEPLKQEEFVKKEEYQYYVIQKNDTLQKISQKFYGTTKRWKYLYEVNKDVIKNPDKIYPGTKIKIPSR